MICPTGTGTPPAQRHDIADAIAQCLAFHYRALQFVYACRPAAAVNPANTPQQHHSNATQPPRSQPSPSSSRRDRQHPPSLAELRGKNGAHARTAWDRPLPAANRRAQQLSQAFQSTSTGSQQQTPESFPESTEQLQPQGTDVPNLETLEARLTPLSSPNAEATLAADKPGNRAP